MKVGDKIRVLQSAYKNKGEVGTITRLEPDGLATIKSPSSDRTFIVDVDFLEDYDWDDE